MLLPICWWIFDLNFILPLFLLELLIMTSLGNTSSRQDSAFKVFDCFSKSPIYFYYNLYFGSLSWVMFFSLPAKAMSKNTGICKTARTVAKDRSQDFHFSPLQLISNIFWKWFLFIFELFAIENFCIYQCVYNISCSLPPVMLNYSGNPLGL